ncbi:tyrosine-type recombinase/integrase [Dactylosporangium cerinum]|uniref:Tyrosine-type recombinase/integrase n=1 Tax=Dactylosporangium cerinum TaxID=1434730 RepID=A0ABV9WJ37_9ACTN
MAHVEDRWYKVVRLPDNKTVRVKTKLFGKGLRYRVRYIAPNGRERSKSFPDRAKKAAEEFLVSVEADKFRGVYVDPGAGRITFHAYAEKWMRTSRMKESTRQGWEIKLRLHILPFFGARQLGSIRPEDIREWDTELTPRYAPSTRAVTWDVLHAILNAAVDDKRIGTNPCAATSVVAPKPDARKVVPWKVDRVIAVRTGLSTRYRVTVDVAAGCGLRVGEVFGLAVDDLDLDGGWLHVRRQVKRVRSRLVFGLPKSDKERRVPLPGHVASELQGHMAAIAPVAVTLPWESPTSTQLVTARLVFTNALGKAVNPAVFDLNHWQKALAAAGVDRGSTRSNGMHALRHFYASALLDAGETIRAVSEYLGHADTAFTLRTYTHLMPASQNRTRGAIDGLLGGSRPDDGLAEDTDAETPGQGR